MLVKYFAPARNITGHGPLPAAVTSISAGRLYAFYLVRQSPISLPLLAEQQHRHAFWAAWQAGCDSAQQAADLQAVIGVLADRMAVAESSSSPEAWASVEEAALGIVRCLSRQSCLPAPLPHQVLLAHACSLVVTQGRMHHTQCFRAGSAGSMMAPT